MQHNDPSYAVHNQLLPHVHLISTFQYPLIQRVTLDQIVAFLMQAPQIVQNMKPMAWTYLAPPQDGTMLLTWQAPRMNNHFASDGYIWLDTEQIYRQPVRGYTVEILVHRLGYIFQHEHIATHQRMRYHIVDKDPSLPSVDPALWLVHWSQADPNVRRPVQGIQIHPQIQKIMQERIYLEQQGAVLQRKEFMLVDRANWPTVNLNDRMQQQVAYQQHPSAPRPQLQQPPPGYRGPQGQAPPKRQKVAQQVIRGESIPDSIFEEDTEFGDYFDSLTPAEISKMRYKQHHEWMEEIFSSVYSLSQIVPEDLGLGLTGSLKQLTEGIFDAPNPETVLAPFNPQKNVLHKGRPPTASSSSYQKLSAEKMDEFEKRIAGFVEKGKADIEAMKKQHAETVAQFNKSKTYMRAERKLREVDGNAAGTEQVVEEVENALAANIVEQKKVVCIEEGGLEKEDHSRVTQNAQPQNSRAGAPSGDGSANGSGNGNENGQNNGNGTSDAFGDNSAANLLDEFGAGSYSNSPAARMGTPGLSQMHSTIGTPIAASGVAGQESVQQPVMTDATTQGEGQPPQPESRSMELMDSMDIDMTGVGGQGTGAEADSSARLGAAMGDDAAASDSKPGAEEDWILVADATNGKQPASAAVEKHVTELPSGPPALAQAPAQPQAGAPSQTSVTMTEQPASLASQPPPTAAEAVGAAGASNEAAPEESGGGIFDTTDFDNTFEGLDTAGDALADFDTGGDDLDLGLGGDDAFGEAFGGGEGAGGERTEGQGDGSVEAQDGAPKVAEAS